MPTLEDQQMAVTLQNINMNLMRIIRLLEEIKREGLNVKTQQSHA